MIGTGALTLPLAFSQAGLTFGLVTFMILSLFSFITLTWVIESMATANAILKNEEEERQVNGSRHSDDLVDRDQQDEDRENSMQHSYTDSHTTIGSDRPLLSSQNTLKFDIEERVELGKMAALFFNKIGLIFFYLCIIIYLYGDLAIYAAAVPKNLRDLLCPYHAISIPSQIQSPNADLCWSPNTNSSTILNMFLSESKNSRIFVYKLCLIVFIIFIGPFTFFNVEKTKFLQIFTTIFRFLAFLSMIGIASFRVSTGEGKGKPDYLGNIHGLPMLFGCSIYSFMNHHSLPGIVTPIKDKSKLMIDIGLVYLIILTAYSLLCVTAVLCFDNNLLEDMYTLNFINDSQLGENYKHLKYFFGLFPVLTLGTSFPIIAVTLCNNLRSLFDLIFPHQRNSNNNTYRMVSIDSDNHRRTDKCIKFFTVSFNSIGVPLLTIIPPTIIAFSSSNLEKLVALTGSYAGAGIQYLIPAFLVIASRRYVADKFGVNWSLRNRHKSPFYRFSYICLTLVWCLICIVFVTLDQKDGLKEFDMQSGYLR